MGTVGRGRRHSPASSATVSLTAVAALSDRDREVVALRYFAGLTEAETGDALGCPTRHREVPAVTAIDRLRDTLREEVVT